MAWRNVAWDGATWHGMAHHGHRLLCRRRDQHGCQACADVAKPAVSEAERLGGGHRMSQRVGASLARLDGGPHEAREFALEQILHLQR